MLPPPGFPATPNGVGYPPSSGFGRDREQSTYPPQGNPPFNRQVPSSHGFPRDPRAPIPQGMPPNFPLPNRPTAGYSAPPTRSLHDLMSMVDDDEVDDGRSGSGDRRPPSEEQPPQNLPPGWVAHMSKSRNTWFYYNEHTRETTWTRPV